MIGGWQMQLFQVMADHNGSPVPRTTAGWVKGPFALDPRQYFDPSGDEAKGWLITHLPTGFSVRGIKGRLSLAQQIADKMLAQDDWDFVDRSASSSRSGLVKALMDEHAEIAPPSDFVDPYWLEDTI